MAYPALFSSEKAFTARLLGKVFNRRPLGDVSDHVLITMQVRSENRLFMQIEFYVTYAV